MRWVCPADAAQDCRRVLVPAWSASGRSPAFWSARALLRACLHVWWMDACVRARVPSEILLVPSALLPHVGREIKAVAALPGKTTWICPCVSAPAGEIPKFLLRTLFARRNGAVYGSSLYPCVGMEIVQTRQRACSSCVKPHMRVYAPVCMAPCEIPNTPAEA